MGLRNWLVRLTLKPADYGKAYASGMMDMIEHLAASIIAYSGKRSFDEKAEAFEIVFESHFDMEQAGFDPLTKDINNFIEPEIEKIQSMADQDLLNNAFKAASAFLCLSAENYAHQYMKSENASRFMAALYYHIVQGLKGRFGFGTDTRQIANTIDSLRHVFASDTLLNRSSFGKGDCLGLLLNQLSHTRTGSNQYGFVVGSEKQSMGCAMEMVRVGTEMADSIKRAARDFKW